MKSTIHFICRVIVVLCVTSAFFPKSTFAQFESLDCANAITLECSYMEATYTYDEGAVSNSIYEASCLPDQGGDLLRDLWFTFNTDGNTGFSFEASQANFGLIVYSGTCGDLEIYDCAESQDNTSTYWVPFFSSGVVPAGQYFIQILHYPYLGNEEVDIVFYCNEIIDWDCSITLDSVEVGNCRDEDGFVNISLSGTTNVEEVLVEIQLDGEPYFYLSEVVGDTWECMFDIQGEILSFIDVSGGNSESGCSLTAVGPFALPEIICVEVPDRLEFILDAANSCNYFPALIKFYEPGTSNLMHTREVELNSSNTYAVFNPPFGTFDVYIKPFGSLQESFLQLEVLEGIYTVFLPMLRKGDLNNSNSIDIFDISSFTTSFGSLEGDPTYHSLADLNCDGLINIFDISILSNNFGLAGDEPPTNE